METAAVNILQDALLPQYAIAIACFILMAWVIVRQQRTIESLVDRCGNLEVELDRVKD